MVVDGGLVLWAGTGRPPHAARLSMWGPWWWGAAWSYWRRRGGSRAFTLVIGRAFKVGGGVVAWAGTGRPPHASCLPLGRP